jgi:hypothetical protein
MVESRIKTAQKAVSKPRVGEVKSKEAKKPYSILYIFLFETNNHTKGNARRIPPKRKI